MTKISQEDAITYFSKLIKPLLSSENPHFLIEAMANFYRDIRIDETTIESDGDMLLLEWGTTKPNITSDFTDFRDLSDDDVRFDTREFQYFSLTRQIFAFDDEETEFDDEAISLCVYLFFEEKSGSELSSNLWISNPNELDVGLDEFLQNPYVRTLINLKPYKVNAFITYVG